MPGGGSGGGGGGGGSPCISACGTEMVSLTGATRVTGGDGCAKGGAIGGGAG